MQSHFSTTIITMIAILVTSSFCFSFSTDGGGHNTITKQATSITQQEHLDDEQFRRWINNAISTDDEKTGTFFTGVYSEDCTSINRGAMQQLPIDGKWPTGPNGWGNFFEHFFNPRTGTGLGSNRTAIGRAEEYEKKIKNLICKSRSRYDQLDDLSKKKVNDYFGRLMHLFEDMNSTSHVKGGFAQAEFIHGIFGSVFENYVKNNRSTVTSSQLFKQKVNTANYGNAYGVGEDLFAFDTMQASAEKASGYPGDFSLTKFECSPPVGNPSCKDVQSSKNLLKALCLRQSFVLPVPNLQKGQ